MEPIYQMSEEVAFELGANNWKHSFYGDPIWYPNKEEFPLKEFFSWGLGMGTPVKKDENGSYITDWENISLGGKLRTDKIQTLEHRLAYIRGRLSGYSVTISDTSISVTYANGIYLRGFLAECLASVALSSQYTEFTIKKDMGFYTPLTPSVTFVADKKLIDKIKG